ncbi:oligosaccharide flippase family protein [Rhodococcus sp. JS3073]|uniref:oligosaccharide flippase family protein n=1 Tax=Rhodococcus sp. JS3073 TaxID=3002901 RepID=UPI002286ADEF|nr:polysaccharide biosynthesis C-terminal domain-containing protein [Rhodococcus sp. JS3073]WAM16835.1 polysaccharide biosynthesis C-terminal domain-containing protein [Rhodococcus sp. JS3073]
MSNVARVVSILIVTILLGRDLGPSILGQFAVLLAAVAILQSVSIGGLSGAAVHKLILGGSRRRAATETIVAARLILIPPAFAIGFALVLTLMDTQQSNMGAIALFFVGYALGAFDVPEITWMSRGGFRTIATRRLILIVCISIPKLAAAASGNYELVLLLQGAEAALWQGILLFRSGLSSSLLLGGVKSLGAGLSQLNELKNLWLSSIAAVIATRADVFIVSALLGSAVVGQYASASRFVEAATILAVAVTTVLFNDLVKSTSDDEEYATQCARAARAVFALSLVVMTGLVTVGPDAVLALYGPEFRLSSELLPVYSVTIIFIFQRQLISKILIIEKAYGYSLSSNVCGLAINVALNLLLVPILGVWGAVVAAIAGYALAIVCAFLVTRRGRDLIVISVGSIGLPKATVRHSIERLKVQREVRVE